MDQETSDEKRVTVRCPSCGYFTMRGMQATRVEVNCGNTRCRSTLEVSIADGVPTVKLIRTKQQA